MIYAKAMSSAQTIDNAIAISYRINGVESLLTETQKGKSYLTWT